MLWHAPTTAAQQFTREPFILCHRLKCCIFNTSFKKQRLPFSLSACSLLVLGPSLKSIAENICRHIQAVQRFILIIVHTTLHVCTASDKLNFVQRLDKFIISIGLWAGNVAVFVVSIVGLSASVCSHFLSAFSHSNRLTLSSVAHHFGRCN